MITFIGIVLYGIHIFSKVYSIITKGRILWNYLQAAEGSTAAAGCWPQAGREGGCLHHWQRSECHSVQGGSGCVSRILPNITTIQKTQVHLRPLSHRTFNKRPHELDFLHVLWCDIMVEADEARKSNDETQTTHGMQLGLATHTATRDNSLATARHSVATLPATYRPRRATASTHTSLI